MKDKFNLLAWGGYICAILTMVSWLQESATVIAFSSLSIGIIGIIPVIVLSLLKVILVDTKFDWKNFLFPIIGAMIFILAMACGIWFNHITLGI